MTGEVSPPDQPVTPPGQAERDQATRLVDLDRLGPTEVVALDRFLRSKRRAHDQSGEGDRPNDGYEKRYAPYANAVDVQLQNLPTRNPAHARDVYAALVDSPVEEDRDAATRMIDWLVPADPEHGLLLWKRLLRDPSPTVRGSAYDQLSNCGLVGGTHEQIEASCQQLGVTGYDVVRLLNAYISAEHGVDIVEARELGELVFRRLISGPPEPSQG